MRRLHSNPDFKIALPDAVWLQIPVPKGVADISGLEEAGLLKRSMEYVDHGLRLHIFTLTDLGKTLVEAHCQCGSISCAEN